MAAVSFNFVSSLGARCRLAFDTASACEPHPRKKQKWEEYKDQGW
jgi:hypothetical protein